MSSIAQMPVARVGETTSISGMWPWCTVVTVVDRAAHELGDRPPAPHDARVVDVASSGAGISPDTSIVASVVNWSANPCQSFVSMQRK